MTTPTQILAGSQVSADELNALGNRVATMTMASAANTTAETVIGSVTVPANDPGLELNGGYEVHLFGVASCTATPSLDLRVRLGSVTGTVVANSNTMTLSSDASDARIYVSFKLMITAAGSSGTLDCMGEFLTNVTGSYVAIYSGTPAQPIDTEDPFTLVITAQWSAASVSNVCTGDVGSIDRI
jgi:hypothetical protein